MTRTATRSCKRETFCAHFRLHDQPTLTIPYGAGTCCRHKQRRRNGGPRTRAGLRRPPGLAPRQCSSTAGSFCSAAGITARAPMTCTPPPAFWLSRKPPASDLLHQDSMIAAAVAASRYYSDVHVLVCLFRFSALCSSSVLCVATTCCLRRTRAAGTGAPRPPLPLPQHRVRPQFRQAVFFLRNRLCSEAL